MVSKLADWLKISKLMKNSYLLMTIGNFGETQMIEML